ncbi:unnamed protein product [Spirodela intermedia]|uniref:CRM domain-containing protein n=1 Tax=Spirodela intermedia TaxID=51605 RepID=A0A7I8JJZ3_SPIIN|nr:unnamed protein product [Spirodela intermedia]CAA6670390.1 unnamed protein product [Spirodela intermedia]
MENPTVVPQSSCIDISSPSNGSCSKPKRKKLKGKRAVVRWLKFFRWKKKKEYNRMTAEEKILYKLRKAKKKETRLAEALEKIEPSSASAEVTHDPEILTPEEHFYLLKMGRKSKNYVPIGRRGIFQGVILNMHLHWKKHQTLKVVVKTFTPRRLTGGIVLDVQEDEDTIIMYRGKNYVQPPPEIMSPRVTLSRKKALDKSKYRDALRAVQKYIPRLEEDMEALRTGKPARVGERWSGDDDDDAHLSAEDGTTESEMLSESEALSDIFDSDSEGETRREETRRPLYLDTIEDFFADKDRESAEDDHPTEPLPTVDEIDKMFLQATTLLKRRPVGRKK